MERVTSLRVLSTVCCLLLAFHVSGADIQRPPENHADVINSTVVLICEAHAAPPLTRIMWGEFASSSTITPISDNEFILAHPNSDRYRIIHNTTTMFYLEIRNLRVEDGGKYVCQDTLSGPPQLYRGEMELIVLDAHPHCTTTVPESGIVLEGRSHTSSCRLYYRGALTPKMTWTGPEPFTLSEVITPTTVVSTISFTIEQSMDSRSYSLTTNFTEPTSVPPGVAGNAPTFEHISQFDTMYIGWGPKNLYADPIKSEYEVGDIIACHADVFPTATYQWVNMDTQEVVNNQLVTIAYDWLGLNSTLRCLAFNSIEGVFFPDTFFMYAYVPDTRITGP